MLLDIHTILCTAVLLSTGSFVASVSNDRSIRFWERSNELINLEEERETEREDQQEREDQASEAANARAQRQQVRSGYAQHLV